jgi:hypothetical protein
LLQEFDHGSHGFNLTQMLADLFKGLFLMFGNLEEVVEFNLRVLRQGLIGQPIRLVVAVPPLDLVLCFSLGPGHMAFDLVDLANDLVGNLPVSRELVAV